MAGGNLKLISTFGWYGGDDNLKGANDQGGGPGDVIKAPATFGWFFDLVVIVGRVKLPTTLEGAINYTLDARC